MQFIHTFFKNVCMKAPDKLFFTHFGEIKAVFSAQFEESVYEKRKVPEYYTLERQKAKS